jgi:chromosome segregation ATPase
VSEESVIVEAPTLDEVKRDLANHKHALAQRDRDWDALLTLIATAVGSDDDREAAEMGEIEEFDPWHALRQHAPRLSQSHADCLAMGEELERCKTERARDQDQHEGRVHGLTAERDAAIRERSEAQAAAEDFNHQRVEAGRALEEVRQQLATATNRAAKAEAERDAYRDGLSGILNDPFCNYDAHGAARSTEDRQWQIGFTDGARAASHNAGKVMRAGASAGSKESK